MRIVLHGRSMLHSQPQLLLMVRMHSAMIVIANSKKYGTGVVNPPNMNDGKFELYFKKI
jgi:hypothetical protein